MAGISFYHKHLKYFRMYLLLNLLTLYCGSVFSRDFPPVNSQRQVITSETIRNAGLTRLGEILFLADNWHTTTVDGFIWQASPAGLASFQGQNWLIMLNGEKMDVGLFDIKNLNMLPVSIAQIDSVEIISTPRIHHSEFSDQGLIHIHTSSPSPGFSVKGSGWFGNETGDPGPYLFTRFTSENIDRIGPDYSLYMDVGTQNWYVRASILYQNHYATDRRIRIRNPGRSNEYFRLQSVAPAIRMGVTGFKGKHELFISHVAPSDFLFDTTAGGATLFIKAASKEFPTQRIFTHVGLKGTIKGSPSFDLFYRIKYTSSEFSKNPYVKNDSLVNLDWKMDNFSIRMESLYNNLYYHGNVGIKLERFIVHTHYPVVSNNLAFSKIYGTLSLTPFTFLSNDLGFQLLSYNTQQSFKGNMATHWRLSPKQKFMLNISLARRLPEEDNSLWFWSERKYDFLKKNNIPFQLLDKFQKKHQLTSDLTWHYQWTPKHQFSISSAWRSFRNLMLEEQFVSYDAAQNQLVSSVDIHTKSRGKVFGKTLVMKNALNSRLDQRISYYYQTAFAGTPIFRDIWKSLPKHKFRYMLNFYPADHFSMWGSLSYQSASLWIEYQQLDQETAGQYEAKLKSTWLLELSAQKYIWQRRLRGSFLLRNLLDQQQRFHPLGASFNLQLYARLDFHLF